MVERTKTDRESHHDLTGRHVAYSRGATLSFLHHPGAMGVLDRKMGNVEKTGADTLVTECPACMMHLSYGARKKGLPIQVRHVSQILDEAYEAGKAT